MASSKGILLVLIGLPLAAAALESPDTTTCSRLAGRFGSTPRELTLSEIDDLRSCINQQRLQMEFAERERRAAQLDAPRRYPARAFSPDLPDDFVP